MKDVVIARPEWLAGDDGSIASMEKFCQLYRQGLIPESILAWMIRTHCLQLLRAVYGSDFDAAIELRQHVLGQLLGTESQNDEVIIP